MHRRLDLARQRDGLLDVAAEVRGAVWKALQKFQAIGEGEVVSFGAYKLPFAYPVLEVGFADRIEGLVRYFRTFDNLHLTGRSSLFRYVHMHDLLRAGRDLVADLKVHGQVAHR